VANHYPNLNPEKALIWRIVHRDNLPWILDNGLHCGNSGVKSANWVHIGNPELTDKRATHPVPLPPGGFLNDYVPFYFTPFSVMMRNIHTGWGGITKRPNEEIVILVSSMHKLKEMTHRSCLRTAMPITSGRISIPTWLIWARLIGRCCRAETSSAMRMIRKSSSAIRPRRWSFSICRFRVFLALCVTQKK